MNYLKKFYLIPWTLWCVFGFIILNIIGFIPLFICLSIGSKQLYHLAHHIPTWISRITCFCWGIRVQIEGLSNFNPDRQYIFVGNHRSMLDAIISSAYIPNAKKYIGKAEVLKFPFIGYIMKKLYIPIQRESKESRVWGREQLIEKSKEKFSLVIFSEGKTNTSTEPLLPFKHGAFYTACHTYLPILPFVLKKCEERWHRSTWLISPGKVKLKFLPLHSPMGNSEENIDKLCQQVHASILKEIISS